MAGLYDNFRLSNSTEIPRFVGSAGDEYIKVGQYKLGQYNTALDQSIDLGTQANEVDTVLAKDKPFADELRSQVQGKIKELTQRGDWENALPELRQLGQNFANRQKEIEAPQQAAAAYKKALEDKEYNLTPEQKNSLYAMSIAGYQGLSKNARGQYVGAFNGVSPAKNLDVNKWVDDRLKDTAISKGGNEYEWTEDGGMWITKDGKKIEYLGKDKLGTILKAAQDNSPDYQSFKNMQGRIAGFNAASSLSDINSLSPTIKKRVQDAVTKYGLHPSVAYGALMQQDAMDDIDRAASTYGINKYGVNNQWTTHDIKTNDYTLKGWSDTGSAGPYVFQGPDSKLSNDEKDYTKLQAKTNETRENMALVQAEVAKLTKDLQGTLSPAARSQKQSDLTNAQNRLEGLQGQANRAEDISNYSKMVTAQGLGYKDYDDFYNKNKAGLERTIAKSYPNGLMTASGRMITKDELTQAAADNRIIGSYTAGGNPVGGATEKLTGATITLKDGTKIPIDGSKGTKLFYDLKQSMDSDAKNIRDFNDKLKEQHSTNVKDFSIQSANIQVPENDRQELTVMLKGMKDGVRFSEPGQLSSVEAPDNFRVVSAGVASTGRDAKLQVEELDKDSKPTGKYYDVVTTNSNVNSVLARKLAASKAPESKQIADMLEPNSGSRQLMTAIPGMTLKAGEVLDPKDKSKTLNASIKIIRHPDKTISYELVDDQGNRLREPTDNVGEAGAWIDAIQGKDTYSNGRKTLVIDKGRTKNKP